MKAIDEVLFDNLRNNVELPKITAKQVMFQGKRYKRDQVKEVIFEYLIRNTKELNIEHLPITNLEDQALAITKRLNEDFTEKNKNKSMESFLDSLSEGNLKSLYENTIIAIDPLDATPFAIDQRYNSYSHVADEFMLRVSPKEKQQMLYQAPRLVRIYDPCLLYTSPSPRDATLSRMPSSA